MALLVERLPLSQVLSWGILWTRKQTLLPPTSSGFWFLNFLRKRGRGLSDYLQTDFQSFPHLVLEKMAFQASLGPLESASDGWVTSLLKNLVFLFSLWNSGFRGAWLLEPFRSSQMKSTSVNSYVTKECFSSSLFFPFYRGVLRFLLPSPWLLFWIMSVSVASTEIDAFVLSTFLIATCLVGFS